MGKDDNILSEIEGRRRELGMSLASLARHAGLGTATVQRALRGRGTDSLTTVRALAEAVGIKLGLVNGRSCDAIRREQARRKAKRITRLTIGNAALEGRKIDDRTAREFERRSEQKLLSASNFALWA